MRRAFFIIVAIAAAATAYAERPMAGAAVSAGADAIHLGEPIVGTSEFVGSYHLTHGHVQGLLEVVPASSIDQVGVADNSIRVYPNPVEAILNVDRAGEPEESNLTLYSSNGTVWLQKPLTESHETVDATSLPAGIYILVIDNSMGKPFTTKIIKH